MCGVGARDGTQGSGHARQVLCHRLPGYIYPLKGYALVSKMFLVLGGAANLYSWFGNVLALLDLSTAHLKCLFFSQLLLIFLSSSCLHLSEFSLFSN